MAPGDAGELLTLQRACWAGEALTNPGVEVPALTETLDDVQAWGQEWTVLVAHRGGRLVAAGRGRLVTEEGRTAWEIGRLMVAPDLHGQGLGRWMLEAVETAAPAEATGFVLSTGARSQSNLKTYRKAGYRPTGESAGLVRLSKRRR
ncbi:GNAT family N-acetyltransferase [Nocardioides yefusunii]|uniref:GNAT family N-acetyltransferase n=1 Tax=Nocardioides yefusunii TaxID=2500546 RepID=A0ABW1QXT2_9ACTN|nr:GNAT family N-acetyltransferase [Nocardioides yefusunii]